jgi:hypothetical protein
MLVILGLFIQAISLVMILRQTGRNWIAHTGVLFVVLSVVYHGLSEIVQFVVPGENSFRWLLLRDALEIWVLIVSVAIFLFSFSYTRKLKQLSSQSTGKTIPSYTPGIIKWHLILALTIPAYLIKVSGLSEDQLGYWMAGLSNQFVLTSIIMASFTLLAKIGTTYIVPVILIQGLMVGLIGSRSTVGLTTFAVLSLLGRYRISVSLRKIVISLLIVCLLITAISAARYSVGRESFVFGDFHERAAALKSGFEALITAEPLDEAILDLLAYRLDGNSFGALVYQQMGHKAYAGLRPFWNNLAMVVPSFLNPLKLEQSIANRNEEAYMVMHYDLPLMEDYTPTTLDVLYCYYGTPVFFVIVIFLGWLFAVVDNWLLQSQGAFAFLVGVGLTICVIFVELGVSVYPNTFRGILTLWLFLAVINEAKRYIHKRQNA